MSRLAGRAATGIDQSQERLLSGAALVAESGSGTRLVSANVFSLPFPDNTFDFSWSRFLFEYLPHPPKALAEMIRVTRPGGIVAVADLDGQIEQFYPLSDRARNGLHDGLQILARTGFDTRVGRKLYSWFRHAGLTDIRVNAAPYQVYSGGVPPDEWFNWETKLKTSIAAVKRLEGNEEYWNEIESLLREEIRGADIFYYCTVITVCGFAQ
jgi:ubiquinone/menaquinone biosynthesis C-methylase UbiE